MTNFFDSWTVAGVVVILVLAYLYAYKRYTDKDKDKSKRYLEALPFAVGLTLYGAAIIFLVNGVGLFIDVLELYNTTDISESQAEIGIITTLGTLSLGISGIFISFGLALVFFLDQKFSQQKVDDLITKRVDKKLREIGKNQLLDAIRDGAAKATKDANK